MFTSNIRKREAILLTFEQKLRGYAIRLHVVKLLRKKSDLHFKKSLVILLAGCCANRLLSFFAILT